MGITNFNSFVAQYAAPTDFEKLDKGRVTAFMRAGRARRRAIVDQTHMFTLLASLRWTKQAESTAIVTKQEEDEQKGVTGATLLKKFWHRVMTYFAEFNTSKEEGPAPSPALVMVWDKARFVNPGKQACQAKRAKRRPHQTSYGPHVVYSMEGVRPAPESVLQTIDIDKAVNSSGPARKALRTFLTDGLTDPKSPLQWPHNALIYVDCEEGCFEFRMGPDGRLTRSEAPEKFHNQCGEADMAAIHWVEQWHAEDMKITEEDEKKEEKHVKQGIHLITIDCDWPMLQMYHTWPRFFPMNRVPPLVWDNGTSHMVDLYAFSRTLRGKYFFTRDALVAMCILCECDYFEKGLATAQVGHDELYKGTVAYLRELRGLERKARKEFYTLEGLRELLLRIYAQKLKCPPTVEALRVQKRHRNMTLLLDYDSLSPVFVAFRLAFDYFTRFKVWHPQRDLDPSLRVDAMERVAIMQQ